MACKDKIDIAFPGAPGGDERLVLLCNEGAQPLTALLQNKEVKPGQKGTIYGTAVTTDTPQKMAVTIAPEDVAVVHIK